MIKGIVSTSYYVHSGLFNLARALMISTAFVLYKKKHLGL